MRSGRLLKVGGAGTRAANRPIVALVSVVALVMLLAVTSSASAGTWTIDSLPATRAGVLGDVSCPSVDFCTALGDANYSGSALPGPLNVISRDGTWTIQSGLTSNNGADDVSCSSPTFCMAVGDLSAALWNGVSWTAVHGPPRHGQSFFSSSSVSCSTETCVAVGLQSVAESGAAQLWRNGALASIAAPLSSLHPDTIDCSSASRCVAVGQCLGSCSRNDEPFAELWNGRSWRAMKGAQTAQYNFTGLSCLSTSWCMAVTNNGVSALWKGRKWFLAKRLPSHTSTLGYHSLSCGSRSSCEAVGWTPVPGGGNPVKPIAAHWDGRVWTNESVPSNNAFAAQLDAVSCPSTSSCTAVGIVYPTRNGSMSPLAESWQP
jgi:hypothetical protein